VEKPTAEDEEEAALEKGEKEAGASE
jgi:hypothetical protein